jgi:hypothetical protein
LLGLQQQQQQRMQPVRPMQPWQQQMAAEPAPHGLAGQAGVQRSQVSFFESSAAATCPSRQVEAQVEAH